MSDDTCVSAQMQTDINKFPPEEPDNGWRLDMEDCSHSEAEEPLRQEAQTPVLLETEEQLRQAVERARLAVQQEHQAAQQERQTAQQERAERQRVEHAYQKSVVEARLLYEAGRLLGSTLDPEKIFDTVHELVSGIMPCDSLLVSAFDPEAKLISCSYAWIEGNRVDISRFPPVPLSPEGKEQGMQSTVIRTGEPLLILDAYERARTSRSYYHVDPDGTVNANPDEEKPQTHSVVIVPIKLDGQVLGLVQLQSHRQRAYTEDDLRILEALVLQMAAASRNAFLYQQIKEELAERKRTEQALRESENKYRDLVETSNDLIWSIDTAGVIRFVNQAAQEIFNYSPAEMIGRRFTDLLTEDQAQKGALVFARLLRGERLRHFEATYSRKGGTVTLLSLNGVPMRDEQGEISGATGTATDINERRRLEEQLMQSQKMEDIGRLAGGIAHDFNNLLTAIIGYAELADMEDMPRNQLHGYLQNVHKAAERAASLTNQLLAFARKQIIEPQIVNLNELIFDIDKMLRRLIGANIELVTLPKSDLWQVKIDPGQFGQVLVNLAVNARDAMASSGKLVIETDNVMLNETYIQHHPHIEAGEYVMLAVTDTGIGMTEEIRAHIFEPFFTTKETGKGTGLGLATCYGIVKQSGGHILVFSEPAQGTTFRIYLPRVRESGKARPAREMPVVMPRGTETLLLVEDEPLVRNIAVQTLHSLGYKVMEAANGSEALRVVDNCAERIHLLVTDVVMPQMGGIELVERLHEEHAEIPVLFTSGYANSAVFRPGVAPELAFLQKPFTPASLARKVREVLDASQSVSVHIPKGSSSESSP